MPRTKVTKSKIEQEVSSPGSYLNLIIGLLIVLIIGVLVFNYFKSTTPGDLGPSQQVSQDTSPTPDVKPESLPGKYTVKDGDTLFTIADHYYKDGYQYNKLVETNQLANPDIIDVGQVLDIPKLETNDTAPVSGGVGGAENQTIWGEKIAGDTYTVKDDDWLSKIAGRAYGDPMQFEKIAKANNISSPDWIEPGTTLKIPR